MTAIKCRLLFKLARNHGWGDPISTETLVNWALDGSEQGLGRQLAEDLRAESAISYSPGQGYSIKNDPDSQAQVACRLVRDCGYTRLQVESTLSRFRDAGGFAAYEMDSVYAALSDW